LTNYYCVFYDFRPSARRVHKRAKTAKQVKVDLAAEVTAAIAGHAEQTEKIRLSMVAQQPSVPTTPRDLERQQFGLWFCTVVGGIEDNLWGGVPPQHHGCCGRRPGQSTVDGNYKLVIIDMFTFGKKCISFICKKLRHFNLHNVNHFFVFIMASRCNLFLYNNIASKCSKICLVFLNMASKM
jgi:hypothetical protein